ncbi:F-box/LRR-repeat protein 12-like [Rutidosis leptorrhynchoides]|uniref:F-box/LRR-repeat protein 12-like n=1 Tax=Rutidosis leptorrhynchoides TaxID=125765 RepID=UPI003A991000
MVAGSSLRRPCNRQQVQLDYDSWYYVFQKLNSTTDKTCFGLTCTSFRDIQNSSCKCLKIRCSDENSIVDSYIIDKLLKRHKKLEKLTVGCRIFYCPHITDSCLNPLLKYGSTLRSLYLDQCGFITETGFSLVASGCPLLSVISLSFTHVTDGGLEILSKSCKFLDEVNLNYCIKITDNGVFFLNQNCRQLRALRISCCNRIHGVGFGVLSPSLSCLEAYNLDLDASMDVSNIVSGGGLEYLSIGTHFPTNIVLEPIGLGGFGSKLKYLNITCSGADDDVIVKISRGCPLLQEWNLTGCNSIGIAGWESIGLYCQNLKTLHVGYCKKLCERGLISIALGCKRLSILVIEKGSQNQPDAVDFFRLLREDVKIVTQVTWVQAPI